MASIRQQIVDKVMTVLAPLPVTVRQPLGIATARAMTAECVVDWSDESVESLSIAHDVCSLQMSVSIYTREIEDAETAADDLMVTAHQLLMVDRLLGGLSQDIRAIAARKVSRSLENEICEVTHVYVIQYRRKSTDISLGYP